MQQKIGIQVYLFSAFQEACIHVFPLLSCSDNRVFDEYELLNSMAPKLIRYNYHCLNLTDHSTQEKIHERNENSVSVNIPSIETKRSKRTA